MRLVFCFFVFLSPLFITAQDCEIPVNSNGIFEIQKVIPLEGITKEKLFSSAYLALIEELNIEIDLVKIYDLEEGIILSDVLLRDANSVFRNYFFRFEIKLEFKEGRYRMKLNFQDITASETNYYCDNDIAQERCMFFNGGFSKKSWATSRCSIYKKLNEKVQNLEESIARIANSEDDRW